MAALEIILIILAVCCSTALFFSFRVKHLNMGYILTTILVIAADILCVLIIGCENVRSAEELFMFYYLINTWMFFCAIWTITRMSSGKWFEFGLIPMGIINLLQSVLIVSCFSRSNILSFDR